MRPAVLHRRLLDWYDANARDLPWRRPGTSPWGVLVSEVMLQQTQVDRVLPAYTAWLERWPTPADLASAAPGDAVRQWDRLGYPRRALRLHQAAVIIGERYDGQVPRSYDELLALPGVGLYTAAAIASFAYGQRHAVLDTNVRRVLARLVGGEAHPGPALTRPERDRAERLLPTDPSAARWAVATMELGALVCTARSPRCDACPVADCCAWRRAGSPQPGGPARASQRYEGTDRQARGRLLAALRASPDPVGADALAAAWPEPEQRERALAGLLADGLVEPAQSGKSGGPRFRLPLVRGSITAPT